MAATPPLPPDDDTILENENPPIQSSIPPAKMPAPPADQDPTRTTNDPQTTLISLMNQRAASPLDLGLRDQEHAAFSRYLLHQLGPVLGPAVVATSVPAYSAAKGGAQALGMMKDATPASFREVGAGLSPLVPQVNPEFANKLYTLMRMWGLISTPDKQVLLGSR